MSTGDDPAPSGTPTPSSSRREVRLVVVGGLIALVAALGGALIGSCATIITQRDQAKETRQAEARSKRAKTYSDFLRVTTEYSIADQNLEDAAGRAPGPDKPCRVGRTKTCGISNDVFAAWVRARNKFTDAIDQVYIYGSPAGVRAARAVAATLSRSLNDEKGRPVYEPPINEGGTFSATKAFRNVMCREVSADPRPTC